MGISMPISSKRTYRKAELAAQAAPRRHLKVLSQFEAWPVLGLITARRKPDRPKLLPGLRDFGPRAFKCGNGIFATWQVGDIDETVGLEAFVDDNASVITQLVSRRDLRRVVSNADRQRTGSPQVAGTDPAFEAGPQGGNTSA